MASKLICVASHEAENQTELSLRQAFELSMGFSANPIPQKPILSSYTLLSLMGLELPSDDVSGEEWRTSDLENSFCMQPFALTFPLVQMRPDMQSSLKASYAAIHEFPVPPKALLGLHSYCPVHFDVFHSAPVDKTAHIGLSTEIFPSTIESTQVRKCPC